MVTISSVGVNIFRSSTVKTNTLQHDIVMMSLHSKPSMKSSKNILSFQKTSDTKLLLILSRLL